MERFCGWGTTNSPLGKGLKFQSDPREKIHMESGGAAGDETENWDLHPWRPSHTPGGTRPPEFPQTSSDSHNLWDIAGETG